MRKLFSLAMVLVITASLITSCGPSATPAPTAPPATAKTFVIGFTASQTGTYNTESMRQLHGLQLWLDDLKKAGGIKLKDGTVYMPDIKFYDDESKTDRIQSLYTKLFTDDKVDFSISPYSSGLTQSAAVVAEQYQKVMITTGAASDTTMEQGYKTIYQIYTPATRYLTGAVDLLAKLDPSIKKLAIVNEKDRFSTDVAAAAQAYAKGKGYDIVYSDGYDTGTTDFSAFINKITAASPDAILGGGHFADGSTFAKQLFEKKVPVRFVSLLVAPPEDTFAQIGDGAQYIVGPSQWEPQVTYSADSAKAAGVPFYGITVKDFVTNYKAKWNEDPSYHSAGGYAAGLVLQRAIEDAGSADPAKVMAALDKQDIMTFYGRINYLTDAKMHGKQAAHSMVYIQWQKDAAGKLAKQLVWPLEAKTADAQLRK